MIGQYLALVSGLLLNGSFLIWRAAELFSEVPAAHALNISTRVMSIESDIIVLYSGVHERAILALAIVSFLLIFATQITFFVGFHYDRNEFLVFSFIIVIIDFLLLVTLSILAYKHEAIFLFYAALSKYPLWLWFGYVLYLCRVVEYKVQDGIEMTGFSDISDKKEDGPKN